MTKHVFVTGRLHPHSKFALVHAATTEDRTVRLVGPLHASLAGFETPLERALDLADRDLMDKVHESRSSRRG